MNIAHLRYFLAVAEVGNFTRAAERVFVAQPTLSGAIARLEAELGVRLIDRAGRRATLTPEGERFAGRAASILAEWQAARAEATPRPAAARLAVAVSRTVAPAAVAGLLAAVRLQRDGEVRLLEGEDDQVRQWLARGRAALAILPSAEGGSLLYRDRIVAMLPADHPLARKPTLRPADLDGVPLLVWTGLDEVPALRQQLDRMNVRPTVTARPRDAATALQMVAAGLGLCLMPDSFAVPGVVAAPVSGVEASRRVVLLEATPLPDAATALVRAAQAWPWRDGGGAERLALAH